MGGSSPPFLREPIEMLRQVLPTAEALEFKGQQHIAMDTASDLFVRGLTRSAAPGTGRGAVEAVTSPAAVALGTGSSQGILKVPTRRPQKEPPSFW